MAETYHRPTPEPLDPTGHVAATTRGAGGRR